jgi:gliding motility-associated lipoprotein GldH
LKPLSTALTALILFVLFFYVVSCNTVDTFEKNSQIPKHQWYHNYEPEISFTITDTTAVYNLFITLRHTHAYAYQNLWLFVSTLQPGDTTFRKERIELTLQQPDGTWIGSGLNDIWELRYPLFTDVRFRKQGNYIVKLKQTMRDNPLLHIMNAGIRIEKVKS